MVIFIDILITFVIGFLIGFTELIQRYSETKYIFKREVLIYTCFYIIFNGIVSVGSLFAVWYFKEVDICNMQKVNPLYILASGFGGMAILRSSIFTIKINGKDVEIGPAQFVSIILNTIERRISNESAPIKYKEIIKLAKQINFDDIPGIISHAAIFSKHITKENKEEFFIEYNSLLNDTKIRETDKTIDMLCRISEFSDMKILESIVDSNEKERKDNETEKTRKHSVSYYLDRLNKIKQTK